ncbi:MAG: RNA methyltransferase [Saprospiraceae bacterium]|nr:RNA methyltransferase [Candidatus Vicinibacter affinis]
MNFVKTATKDLKRISAKEFKTSPKVPIILMADHIRSGHNVGSLFRIADAFGLEEVLLVGYTVKPPHPEINKTALGATETINWKHFEHPEEYLTLKKSEGYRIMAVEQTDGSQFLHQLHFNQDEKYVLIFGNEVNGVSDSVLSLCDECIEIPQKGTKHSLNVSVAAGLVTWHIFAHFL